MNFENLFTIVFIIMMYAGYRLVKKFVEKCTESFAKPCDELAQSIREVRQGVKEVKASFEDEKSREEFKQVAAAALVLGVGLVLNEVVKNSQNKRAESARRRCHEIAA